MEKPVIRISVRNLVEFILRNGDLESGGTAGDKEAMLKGSRLHRKIQKQMGSHYQAEVSLKKDTEYEDLILRVEGRADGIFTQNEKICIDEIKGVYKNLELLAEPVLVHRAQALCYAWIYLDDHGLEEIDVQMTYAHLDTEMIKRFRETMTKGRTGELVPETVGFLSQMAFLSDEMARGTKSVDGKTGISIYLSKRTERDGCGDLPCNFQKRTDFYSGADWCW